VQALENLVARIGQPGSLPSATVQTLGAELVARASTGESTPS
jgi:hypothetical protein